MMGVPPLPDANPDDVPYFECACPQVNGAYCDDGNACSQTDTCEGGVCNGGDPVVCTASDQCHDAGTCNPSDGTCSNPPAVGGA